jgi:hypothetical protein
MPIPPSPRFALCGRALPLALAALFVSGCVDRNAPTLPEPVPAGALESVTRLLCTASTAEGTVDCDDPALDGADQILGGQGYYVRLASSNVSYAGGVFAFDATVQNLSDQPFSTEDGNTRHAGGVKVFFHQDVMVTSGSGEITVANATGTDAFTGAVQPYFQYGGSIGGVEQPELGGDGILSSAEVSSARNWQLNVPATVNTFSFVVYVSTRVPGETIATVAPQVSGVSAAPLVPGQSVTLTGINFNPTPLQNLVTLRGVAVTVTAATPTSLTVTVPCVLSGGATLQVTTGGMMGVPTAQTVQVPVRTLAVGESVVVHDAAEAGCNELPATGGTARYVVAVYSTSTTPNSDSPFIFSSDAAGSAGPTTLADHASTVVGTRGMHAAHDQLVAPSGSDPHLDLLEKNRQAYEQLHRRFAGDARMRPSRNVVAADPVPPPLTRTFRISNIAPPAGQTICSSYYVTTATRVYYDGKLAIYEDDATPEYFKQANNATMAASYQKIGDQFNADMEPIIRNNFGDVLRRDQITDNNGVLVALFTPRINNTFSGVAGFVVSCDQFPNDDTNDPGVGGPYTSSAGAANGASNFGEFFYAYQPVIEGSGYSGNTAANWYRTIRSTFIHETKHVASMAARVANNSPTWEAAWLEEGTARHSEELWMRNAVDNVAWKGNTGYGSATNPINVYCDVRPGWAECDANPNRPASIMQRHFDPLYTYMNVANARLLSPFGATSSDGAAFWYALSWSLVRYAIDRYGTSDADFLTALTQATTNGTTNLSARAGVSIEELLGHWALAFALDDHPSLASPSPATQIPTWNYRSIYAGLNADFPGTYTRVYPLIPTPVTLGTFQAPTATNVRGGGVLWYELSGTHSQAQLLRLRGNNAALPSTLRIAIARIE